MSLLCMADTQWLGAGRRHYFPEIPELVLKGLGSQLMTWMFPGLVALPHFYTKAVRVLP